MSVKLNKCFGFFLIFEHPFGAIRPDVGPSRRRGWIGAGRVRPGIAPRGPWVKWDLFLEFGILESRFASPEPG